MQPTQARNKVATRSRRIQKPIALTEQELKGKFGKLPKGDQLFLRVCAQLVGYLKPNQARYHPLEPDMRQVLAEADDPFRFSLILECLGPLLKAPIFNRICRAATNGKASS